MRVEERRLELEIKQHDDNVRLRKLELSLMALKIAVESERHRGRTIAAEAVRLASDVIE